MLTQFLLSLALMPAEVAAKPTSVLIMAVQPEGGVPASLCKQVTSILVHAAGEMPGYHVVAHGEVEATMSAEALRQLAGCNSASCAAEIAGSLNTDQVVTGTMGNLGDSYVLSLSRITAKDANVVGRAQRRFDVLLEDDIADAMPKVTAQLFGVAGPAADGKTGVAQPGAATASARVLRGFFHRLVVPLRVVAGMGLAVGALGGLLSGAAWAIVIGVTAHDLSLGGRYPMHKIRVEEALISDVAFVAGGALGAVVVLLAAGSLAGLGVSWVLR